MSVELGGFGAGLAVGAGHDLLDPQARGLEALFAMGLEQRAALVQLDGLLQRRLARLQLADDAFQLSQGLLEGERVNVSGVGNSDFLEKLAG